MSPAPGPGRPSLKSDPQPAIRPQYRLDKPQDLLWPVATQWLAIGVLTLCMAVGVWQIYPKLADLSAAVNAARTPGREERSWAARMSRLEFENETQAARILQLERQLAKMNARPPAASPVVNFGARPRVRFELHQGVNETLAPGVALVLDRIDAALQRVSGSIRLVMNGEAIPIRALGVLESMHLTAGGQGFDLIITAITADTAVGYVVLPSPPEG